MRFLTRAGNETDSTRVVFSTVLVLSGTLMLVFRRRLFDIAAEIFGRGRLRGLYDLETRRGRRTLLFSFTAVPAAFVLAGAFGLVAAVVR